VDIKLDYKPRRVDYRALRDGRTIELMNFFHFDGAEMTLRRITLSGVSFFLSRSYGGVGIDYHLGYRMGAAW
jgi:hypothetical protein